MSALQCPVCRGDFREVLKEGILIDVCTQCRGVWLDRGELEKLLSLAAGGTVAQPTPQPAPYVPPQQPHYQQPPQPYPQQPYHQQRPPQVDKYGRPVEYDKYGRKIEYDKYGHRKKKKGFDMLDIFDFD
ncbi:zf-TFIIB domain-containing protein [Asticcacaulis excentricus]|uniref:TFIIB-type zinc ribbon-containing protein n=1 Tax=Asticcacaulis excentricus TaxID=78587 RepID=UPI000F84B3D8|nr:zf-TFIIB domain-containing protein [Asticcacaulis excentricus]